MAMKPHLEFFPVDMITGWQMPPGYKPGFTQKTLATDLDEVNKRGSRTRLLRIAPGEFSEKPFIHDHWEDEAPSEQKSAGRENNVPNRGRLLC